MGEGRVILTAAVAVGCASRCRSTLLRKNNLDGLKPVGVAGGARLLAVFGPAHPTEVLRVHAVVHIVMFGEFAGETNLKSL